MWHLRYWNANYWPTGYWFPSSLVLTTDDITPAQDIEQVSFSQNYNLSANDLAQTQAIPVTSLLSIDTVDLTQTQAISVTSLSQNHNLSANDLAQTQAISVTSLSQNHNISIDDLAQTQAIDNAYLYSFSAADITQPQTTTSPVLQETLPTGSYWHQNYWAANFWHPKYWAGLIVLYPTDISSQQNITASLISHYGFNTDNISQAQSLGTGSVPTFVFTLADVTQPQSLDNGSFWTRIHVDDIGPQSKWFDRYWFNDDWFNPDWYYATPSGSSAQLEQTNFIQGHWFIASNVNQPVFVYTPTLTENFTFSVDSLQQEQVLGTSALGYFVFAIDGVTQNQFIISSAVTAYGFNSVIADNLEQSVSIGIETIWDSGLTVWDNGNTEFDAPSINHFGLPVNDLLQQQSIGQSALSFDGYFINPDAVIPAQTLATPVITQVHGLDVGGVSNQQQVGSVTLIENFTFTPATVTVVQNLGYTESYTSTVFLEPQTRDENSSIAMTQSIVAVQPYLFGFSSKRMRTAQGYSARTIAVSRSQSTISVE